MNVGEAKELLIQFEHDLETETDPSIKAWYEQEFKLQPEYTEAMQIYEALGLVATRLNHLIETRAAQAEQSESESETESLQTADQTGSEAPRILTEEEQLHKRIENKYTTCHKQYEADIEAAAKVSKKSKREHQQKLARRKFIRNFADFRDVTGDEHLVQSVKQLDWITDNVITDHEFVKEIFDSCAAYAEKHGEKVTADPENFAAIIAGSVSQSPHAARYEKILAGIFSTRHNKASFPNINVHLAEASFELLDNFNALKKVVSIAFLRERYMSPVYARTIIEFLAKQVALGDDGLGRAINASEARIIFNILNEDITGLNYSFDKDITNFEYSVFEKTKSDSPSNERVQKYMLLGLAYDAQGYDKVKIQKLTNETELDIGYVAPIFQVSELLQQSTLHRKRMQDLAPYSYAIKAAKTILGDGVHGKLFPISPSTTVDVFIPQRGYAAPTPTQARLLDHAVSKQYPELLSVAAQGSKSGISSYEETGELSMVYLPLFDEEKEGIIVLRPHIPLDTRTNPKIQLLSVNRFLAFKNTEQEGADEPTPEEYARLNEEIRQEISSTRKRFLGRRPVQFVMNEKLRQTGLEKISLRLDPKNRLIKGVAHLKDGDVPLDLDGDLRIVVEGSNSTNSFPYLRYYYENIILSYARIWMCRQEVHTSEGTVNENGGNTTNLGHFAYLRILPDGRKARFSEEQRRVCLEEQGKDLAEENQRLQQLDPTGKKRNATYVREYYDPHKPPLVVYVSLEDSRLHS